MEPCPFCAYASGETEPDGGVEFYDDVMVFAPLRPFVEGHRLVVPVGHVAHLVQASPDVVGAVMWRAAREAFRFPAANILTSVGEAATQTVPHWHVHVVPRQANDDLGGARGWPWHDPRDGGPIVRRQRTVQIHMAATPPVIEGYSSAHLAEAFHEGLRRGRAGG